MVLYFIIFLTSSLDSFDFTIDFCCSFSFSLLIFAFSSSSVGGTIGLKQNEHFESPSIKSLNN